MAAKHLNLEPHNIDDDAWWYEGQSGSHSEARNPQGNRIETQ